MTWSYIKARIDAFRDETRGSVSVEFIVMAPIVFWAWALEAGSTSIPPSTPRTSSIMSAGVYHSSPS